MKNRQHSHLNYFLIGTGTMVLFLLVVGTSLAQFQGGSIGKSFQNEGYDQGQMNRGPQMEPQFGGPGMMPSGDSRGGQFGGPGMGPGPGGPMGGNNQNPFQGGMLNANSIGETLSRWGESCDMLSDNYDDEFASAFSECDNIESYLVRAEEIQEGIEA